MRTSGLVGSLAMISACSSPAPQPANQATANISQERLGNSAAAPVHNEASIAEAKPQPAGRPCRVQDGEAVTHKLKALGTEPFWAAEVDGRCVTYKTPEDQAGTRVWAHVDTGPQGPVWNGALRGKPFQLIVKPAAPPGCSDGMSDRTYAMDATLRVDRETRNGCAEML